MGHIPQKAADCHKGAGKGEDKADEEKSEIVAGQGLPGAEKVVARGQKHGRNGEEKRKFCGRLPGQAKEQTTDNGGAGTGHPGKQSQGLGASELERIPPGELFHAIDAYRARLAFHHEDADAAQDQSCGNSYRVEQVLFDEPVQGEPQEGRGAYGHNEVAEKALVAAAPQRSAGKGQQACPVVPAHREDGAELDDDRKGLGLFPCIAEYIFGNDEMAGAGYGQKLCQPLHQAKDDGLKNGKCVHDSCFCYGMWLRTGHPYPWNGHMASIFRNNVAMLPACTGPVRCLRRTSFAGCPLVPQPVGIFSLLNGTNSGKATSAANAVLASTQFF